MNKPVVFQICLDLNIIEQFNETLDEQEHISEQLTFPGIFRKRRYLGISAWDCICSCVHRIRDTVDYLNKQQLGSMNGYRSAFDFINFINNAAVILDSIQMLADILGVDLAKEDKRTDVFNQLGIDGGGTDKLYFEFIRSLCAVHPVETSRHKQYQVADIVSCPFLTWVRGTIWETLDDCDLHANAFVNETNSWGKAFVSTWIRFLRTSSTGTVCSIK